MDSETLEHIRSLNMLIQSLIDHNRLLQDQLAEAMRLAVMANYKIDSFTDQMHAAGICSHDSDPSPSNRVEGL